MPQGETTPTASATFNKGYLRFPNAPFGISTAWRNTALTYSSPSSFTVNDQGQTVNMERYTVTYSFTLSDADYCILENFHTYFRIATDCSEFPLISYIGNPSYIADQLTPSTYNVYNYGAMNNGSNPSLDQFDTYPLIPSPPPCHAPSTSSPTHKIQYRKQGTSTWTEVTSSNLATVTVNVTSTGPGTYEYQSKGLLDGSGNYSPWSATSTVIVY